MTAFEGRLEIAKRESAVIGKVAFEMPQIVKDNGKLKKI